jgi:hypothetical protein
MVGGQGGDSACLKSASLRILSIKFCLAKLESNVQRSHPWLTGGAFPPPIQKYFFGCLRKKIRAVTL